MIVEYYCKLKNGKFSERYRCDKADFPRMLENHRFRECVEWVDVWAVEGTLNPYRYDVAERVLIKIGLLKVS